MPKVYEHRLLNTPDPVMNAIFVLPQVFYVRPRVPADDNVGLNPLYLLLFAKVRLVMVTTAFECTIIT